LSITVESHSTQDKPAFQATTFGKFARNDRLLTPEDYKFVFDKAVKTADSAYTILARPNSTSTPRLGVIVSKKNVAHASARNRLKRIVRESFRHHKETLPAYDIVVICRSKAEQSLNNKLFEKLQKHWKFLHNHAQ
jgi:ribonuclease P protein component